MLRSGFSCCELSDLLSRGRRGESLAKESRSSIALDDEIVPEDSFLPFDFLPPPPVFFAPETPDFLLPAEDETCFLVVPWSTMSSEEPDCGKSLLHSQTT